MSHQASTPGSNAILFERNALVKMRDGVELAVDVIRPDDAHRRPAILNFNPYHKDGRGGRTAVESVHRHFAARGYAAVTADLRGLGNSGGTSPECFAPQEALDGHDLVEWIAAQPWCDGNVGMWGVSYPGITSLSAAAMSPPHLKAIVPIHATSDLHRGVVSLGGTRPGFWMRADWGPRMLAYNLMPPQFADDAGRWARVWAEHLAENLPWIADFAAHPGFDQFWQSRVADMSKVTVPTLHICGWRDLYTDCTPLDYLANAGPKRLIMGAWKHEFPDSGREAPAAGLAEMERWFGLYLMGRPTGIDREPPVNIYLQGREGFWRAETQWPPARQAPIELNLAPDGTLGGAGEGASSYDYDPTVGLHSLAWDPWTTSLDPSVARDHSADDARSLCFTSAPLTAPMELIGNAEAMLDVTASALPLNLVVKLSAVAPNGRSVLITTGWIDLATQARSGTRGQVRVPLRATGYRLLPGERLRVSVACADFPRVWPTPVPATLVLHHGASRIRLPVCPEPAEPIRPNWGRLQSAALASPNDSGGGQTWDISRDLMTDTARLSATKSESVRIDGTTRVATQHEYGAAVAALRPDLARMHSNTTVRIEQPVQTTELTIRTLTTSHAASAEVRITIDGQPFWHRTWNFTETA
ncbi:MAG: CocE/NonD family hydrolase [Alphaproteobacteria bacterium]|nr:CocE/NonD family hydrolase [Alphaproteobacteria bacterium]